VDSGESPPARSGLATERSENLAADVETELASSNNAALREGYHQAVILTGCASQGSLGTDYVIRRFKRESIRAETSFSAISRSMWNDESAEMRPLFKAAREGGSRFRAELDCS